MMRGKGIDTLNEVSEMTAYDDKISRMLSEEVRSNRKASIF